MSIFKVSYIFLILIFSVFNIITSVFATRWENRNWLKNLKETRINSKQPSKIEEFPYQVMVEALTKNGKETLSICGGVILNESYVLTAAHCLLNSHFGEKITHEVHVGSIRPFQSFESEEDSAKTLEIKKFLVHEKYDSVFMTSNLALIEVDGKFWDDETGKRVKGVDKALLTTSEIPENISLTVLGWGDPEVILPGDPDHILELYYAEITRHSNRKCMLEAERSMKGRFCGFAEKETGICTSSSGSAAIADGKLVGIVSMGGYKNICIFTDLWYYRDWILHNNQSTNILNIRILFTNLFMIICVYNFYPL